MTRPGSAAEVFAPFLKLGLTPFGGPVAHLGYFRGEFVERRRSIADAEYADLVALCQFLPGPAISQVGIAIGSGAPAGSALSRRGPFTRRRQPRCCCRRGASPAGDGRPGQSGQQPDITGAKKLKAARKVMAVGDIKTGDKLPNGKAKANELVASLEKGAADRSSPGGLLTLARFAE